MSTSRGSNQCADTQADLSFGLVHLLEETFRLARLSERYLIAFAKTLTPGLTVQMMFMAAGSNLLRIYGSFLFKVRWE